MTLPALIDEFGHRPMAFFAFFWPSSASPAIMIALMVYAQVLCDRLYPLMPTAFVDVIASIDLSSTLQESMLHPVFATTRLPSGTTNITKLKPTPAAILMLDHAPTVLAPLPALLSRQLNNLLKLFVFRAVPFVPDLFTCNACFLTAFAAGSCRVRIIGRRNKNGAASAVAICSIRCRKLNCLLTELADHIGIEEDLTLI